MPLRIAIKGKLIRNDKRMSPLKQKFFEFVLETFQCLFCELSNVIAWLVIPRKSRARLALVNLLMQFLCREMLCDKAKSTHRFGFSAVFFHKCLIQAKIFCDFHKIWIRIYCDKITPLTPVKYLRWNILEIVKS